MKATFVKLTYLAIVLHSFAGSPQIFATERMDVSNTNGGDRSLSLATINNDVSFVHAAALKSIW